MAFPTERVAAIAEGTATRAMLRLVAVFLAFGIVDLVAAGLHALRDDRPGRARPGPPGPVLLGFRSDASGGTWALLYVLVAILALATDAALLIWAHRRREREDGLAAILVLGLGGLVARLLMFGASIWIGIYVGRLGHEALLAHSIASNIAGMVGGFGGWVLRLGLLVALLVALQRHRRDAPREGPFREAAA